MLCNNYTIIAKHWQSHNMFFKWDDCKSKTKFRLWKTVLSYSFPSNHHSSFAKSSLPIIVIPRIASCSALPQFSQTFAYREAYASMFFVTLQSLIRKIASSNYCNTTNCFVLRTPAILSDIRISRSLRSAFMRMSERVIIPYSHSCASTSWLMVCDPGITWSQISSTGLTGAGCQEVPARPSYQ